MPSRRLYIVDAMALAFRSFYALGRSSLTTAEGIPTGAIFGSAMFLNKLIADEKPDYLAIVTDADGPTFRHEMYEGYKATRDKMPEDLAKQLPYVWELFGAFKAPLLRVSGVEADDVIATLAVRHAGKDLTAYIVSGDKDFLQLVGDHVIAYAPKRDQDAQILDRAGVKEKMGVEPEQIVDLLALVGDTVDNVPGVTGIGDKGAAKLIQQFGSLDGIYANIDLLKGKQKENLLACKEDAYLSQRLVTLKTDCEVGVTLEDLRCPPDAAANEALRAFYERFEFKVLANKVAKAMTGKGAKAAPAAVEVVESRPEPMRVEAGNAPAGDLKSALQSAKAFALAVRSDGFDVATSKALEVAVHTADGGSFVVPVEHAAKTLKPWLEDKAKAKVGHGLKLALQMLKNAGLPLAGELVDVKICDYLIDPNNYNHELDGIAAKLRTRATAALDDPAAVAADSWRFAEALLPKIDELGLGKVLRTVEMPLVPVLAAMEQEGVYVDAEMLAQYSAELDVIAKRVEADIYKEAGETFNINSPKQLQELLFEKLALGEKSGKRLKKTKTGYSTDESVLSKLDHPVPKLILEYRSITKLKNTYVDTLPQFINPKTQRIHATISQTVAATGRLSCDRPNLQNIPMRTPLGRKIREAFFAPDPGDCLISADYSQVELRLLAHLARAEGLIEAFKAGLDIHTVTAAKIFNVPIEGVDKVMRSRAKAVNFGIIYGMGPQRLAAETNVSLSAAKDFIARYFQVYPGIRDYTEHLIADAKEKGYTTTMLGRRRPIPELRDKNRVMAVRGENIAVNAPIQGSAADLIKLAMIRVHEAIATRGLKLKLLLQVHDELLFSCPSSEVERNVPVIRACMEHALETSVPLKVDIRSGRTWLDAH